MDYTYQISLMQYVLTVFFLIHMSKVIRSKLCQLLHSVFEIPHKVNEPFIFLIKNDKKKEKAGLLKL